MRQYDPPTGTLSLSDRSTASLEVSSLHASPLDGALLCTIKRDVLPKGLLARFSHAAQAELLNAVEDGEHGSLLRIGGVNYPLPCL